MKKYILIIGIIITAILITAVYLKNSKQNYPKKQSIRLALVANTADDIGQEMINGARLYVNALNQKGGLFGKKVQLHVFDDLGKTRKATQIADKISSSNQILLVLGHSNNICSVAAGRIYKKVGIPAIAASATSSLVTRDNEWYFRTIPNDEFQAKFIAHYIYRALKLKSAAIIYDTDDFGKFVSAAFESEARKIGLHIKRKWEFDKNSKTITKDLEQILHALRSVNDLDILFLGTDESFSSQIISSVHYPETHLAIIGTFSFTHPSFLKKMQKQFMEQKNPGFFTNGLYATLPYMSELSEADNIQFLKRYNKTYQKKPSWYAATYYDACKVAVEAIKKSGIHNAAIGKKRMDIKDALQSMYHQDYAIKGVMGYHFFNEYGDVQLPVKVAEYKNQSLVPAFAEYFIDLSKEPEQDMGHKILQGDKIIIDQLKMNKAQIVYSGLSINKITEINVVRQTCTFDFYIWFKFQHDFDPGSIVFENAVQPIHLEKPVIEKKENGINLCLFQITGTFKQYFDLRAFPFDHQQLAIVYRHKTFNDHQLKLVVDPDNPQLSSEAPDKLRLTTGWELLDELVQPDIKIHELQTGINREISYSLIHYNASIKRVHLSGVIRHFFPIVVMALISCIVIFLPGHKIMLKMVILSAIMIANAVYHMNVYVNLNVAYITAIEYIYIGFYIFLLFIALILFFLRNVSKMNKS
jgi:ABC-type branched-subunit amino acid transport system substrate-binding protein